ncbi:MAG: acyl-CoA dehydrogenase family protein [Chloroflexi bacterium]|nr:acyl-CoA dehydrogenase family protein [Chloroflexota bacterium]
MDLSLSENQEMLKKTAREFIEKEYPWQKVRDIQQSPQAFQPETWKQLNDLGWLGLPFPETQGGAGGDFMDTVVLLEEIGRGLLPSPFQSTVAVCGPAILQFGSDAQKKAFLPAIAAGQRILAFALTEADAKYEASSIDTTAKRDGANYVLDGTKMFVRDGNIADHLLVIARTDPHPSGSARGPLPQTGEGKTGDRRSPLQGTAGEMSGLTAFLVDAKSPGIMTTLLRTAAMDRQSEIVFNNVKVPAANILGKPGQGWDVAEWTMKRAILAECAELVGAMQKVLETTIQYAKDRVQFGRPIGSFQGLQFKVADMVTDTDGARFITYYAVWKLLEGQPCDDDIARAKVWVSEASRRVVREGHQIHGGIGFITEHFLHLYTRRCKSGELIYGSADSHRKAVAAALLD